MAYCAVWRTAPSGVGATPPFDPSMNSVPTLSTSHIILYMQVLSHVTTTYIATPSNTMKLINYYYFRMVRKRSIKALEHEIEIQKAVLAIKSNQYKSIHAAVKALGLPKDTLRRRVNGGNTRIEARQQQQLLSKTQEQTLLKWIKQLTSSGYAPSHWILREVADEVRTNRCRIYQGRGTQQQQQQQTQELQPQLQLQIPKLPLRQDWVPRFIQRHPNLCVKLGRRVEAQKMNGVTKQVLKAWFDAYKSLIIEQKIENYNTYNMDETGFSIGTM
jgi:hypothetical protein